MHTSPQGTRSTPGANERLIPWHQLQLLPTCSWGAQEGGMWALPTAPLNNYGCLVAYLGRSSWKSIILGESIKLIGQTTLYPQHVIGYNVVTFERNKKIRNRPGKYIPVSLISTDSNAIIRFQAKVGGGRVMWERWLNQVGQSQRLQTILMHW